MQTFLPYPDFKQSAAALDYRRLGQQRRECYQLLRTMLVDKPEAQKQVFCEDFDWTKTKGWRNHPAGVQWHGYEAALAHYSDVMIDEWVARGYKNTMLRRCLVSEFPLPPWLGRPDIHASHRSNLLRKDPVYYGKFGWTEPTDLEYVYPSKGA